MRMHQCINLTPRTGTIKREMPPEMTLIAEDSAMLERAAETHGDVLSHSVHHGCMQVLSCILMHVRAHAPAMLWATNMESIDATHDQPK